MWITFYAKQRSLECIIVYIAYSNTAQKGVCIIVHIVQCVELSDNSVSCANCVYNSNNSENFCDDPEIV